VFDNTFNTLTYNYLRELLFGQHYHISDHFLVIATISLQVLQIICSTSLRCNFRNLDEDVFCRRILTSSVYENPKSNTSDFANQLTDDLGKILDELISLKKPTQLTDDLT